MGQPPAIVATLVERFEHNRDSYKGPGYNETQLRRGFLDPVFEAPRYGLPVLHGRPDLEAEEKRSPQDRRISERRRHYPHLYIRSGPPVRG